MKVGPEILARAKKYGHAGMFADHSAKSLARYVEQSSKAMNPVALMTCIGLVMNFMAIKLAKKDMKIERMQRSMAKRYRPRRSRDKVDVDTQG